MSVVVDTAVEPHVHVIPDDPDELTAAVVDPDAPRALVNMVAAACEHRRARLLAVRHWKLSYPVMEALLHDPDDDVRAAAVRHSKMTGYLLDDMTGDPSIVVRLAIAQHPHVRLGALEILMSDPSEMVRAAVAANHRLPRWRLQQMTADPSEMVRSAVRHATTFR